MIDLHSHILPGLDDGSRTVEDARALARRAAQDGVTAIAATPHVRSDYPTRPEEMERGVLKLREDFLEHGIHVEVLHGGELDLVALGSLDDDDLRRFSLARSGRYLLLEFPYS
ncbi:MAG: CpsB/CapC family capsule biosynthesis tyrosine phosphatase, partial [Gaiellaceae bacterium]